MASPDETRRIERVAVKIPVRVKIDPSMEKDFTLSQRELDMTVVDMSPTGLGVTSSVYIPDGIVLIADMDAQMIRPERGKENNRIRLTGEVVSSRMIGGQYRLGILVKEIGDEDKSAILKFIKGA